MKWRTAMAQHSERQSPGRTALVAQIDLLLGMFEREAGSEFYTIMVLCKAKILVAP